MNLNDLARDITLREGKTKSLSIAQVKEVMKIAFTELGKMTEREIQALLRRYMPTPVSKKK